MKHDLKDANLQKESPDPCCVFDEYKFGDEDIALFHFARKVLSITANSASCERLFSAYGIILNKHRNRLLLKNLQNQAELKAHTRDEHIRDNNKRKRLKRHFSTHKDVHRAENTPAPPSPIVPQPCSNTISSPSEPTQSFTSDVSPTSDDTTPIRSDTPYTLRHFVEQQSIRGIEDNTDNEPIFPPTQFTRLPLIPIANLFDFDEASWQKVTKEAMENTFDQELELFELLDLDADGEDAGIDVDDMTEDVLIG